MLGGRVAGGRVAGVNDMPCCPRETSPRSLPFALIPPQVARCREVSLRVALPSPSTTRGHSRCNPFGVITVSLHV